MFRVLALALAAIGVTAAQPAIDAPSPATVDGRPAPVVDYARFLSNEFGAEVYVTGLQDILLFPPPGLDFYAEDHGEYVVRTSSGAVVRRQPIGTFIGTGSPVFVRFNAQSDDWSAGPMAPGDYLFDLVFQGQVAGRIPFRVRVDEGDDPFNPTTQYVYEGPWETLGFFEQPSDDAAAALRFTAWVRPSDLGDGFNPSVTFTLLHDGTPVAASQHYRGSQRFDHGAWVRVTDHLVPYAERGRATLQRFRLADLTAGAYTLELRRHGDGELIKTFAMVAVAGTITPHPRSTMDYEPRHGYLTPRRVVNSNYEEMVDTFWVEVVE